MKKILFLFLLFFNVLIIHAQHADSSAINNNESTEIMSPDIDNLIYIAVPIDYKESPDKIFLSTEVPPMYVDGDVGLLKHIITNLIYPKEEKEANISGKVLIQFVIEKDGSISNIEVLKKVSPGIDNEAKRLIESTNGKWTPGKNNGLPVRVYYTIPIRFYAD